MAEQVHAALRRVHDATVAARAAQSAVRGEIARLNELIKDAAVLEAYAREKYPDNWDLIQKPDSPEVYTALNKEIPRFDGWQTIREDPVVQRMITGELPPQAAYAARELTSKRMREKRSRIRLARKRSRIH